MVGFKQRWAEKVGLQVTIQGVDFRGDGWVSFGSDLLLDLDDSGGWEALIYSNSMAVYVLDNLVAFVTDIWQLNLKHAVSIMNIKGEAAGIMGLVEAALIDAYLGHAGMLLITSVLYSIGLGLLVMSVHDRFFSKGVKSCPAGEKLCSSKLTASPFYWGLALIVLAKAGQGICLRTLTFSKIKYKKRSTRNEVFDIYICNGNWDRYIFYWIRIPSPPQLRTSPLTNMLRVLLAAFLNRHLDSTKQGTKFNYGDENQTPQGQGHNQKAPQGPKKRTTLTDHLVEVEETKLLLRMVSISVTFILYGVIKSNNDTFFIAQGYAMNMSFRFILQNKQHQIQLPIQIFGLMAGFATFAVKPLYRIVFEQRIERMNGRYLARLKVGLGMLSALASCKVAWWVEYKRLKSLKEHGLLGNPNAIAPISIFWLSPQFVLMGIMDGLARDGMEDFFKYQVPESMRKRYAVVLIEVVIGWGKILNIGFIMILDVVVEKLRVEDGSWIVDTVNQSRLDLFYIALLVVSMANLFIFDYVASFYTYSDFLEEEDNDEKEDPHEEIKTGKKQDKMEPTPDEEIEPTLDEETERAIRTT
ncbi:protein NRT1/ PTR FAMILY 5.4-like [Camellia sinensis]|uniref:protein NRT1/ PTR FAMILY 5.4-like n=1 Tax=Camellia sinensis TaxID=4442 RepID=UPI0010357161|nr:protein NRT1/ PTR FAMILY 5.4-like [Camellia sinensis]